MPGGSHGECWEGITWWVLGGDMVGAGGEITWWVLGRSHSGCWEGIIWVLGGSYRGCWRGHTVGVGGSHGGCWGGDHMGAGGVTWWVLGRSAGGVTRWVLGGDHSGCWGGHTVGTGDHSGTRMEAWNITDRRKYVTINMVNLYFLFTHSQVLSPKGSRESQEVHNVLHECVRCLPNSGALTPATLQTHQ